MATCEETIKHFESLQKRYTTQRNNKQCEFVRRTLEALELLKIKENT